MSTRAIEPWMVEPLGRFVHESSARLVLLMTPAGQVLAQYGFSRAVDVMAAAALGAAIMASTTELANQMREPPFAALNHQGARHGIFLSAFTAPRGRMVALVVYDTAVSSLGLVQLFFEQLVAELVAAAPKDAPQLAVLAEDFERELNESLSALFGR